MNILIDIGHPAHVHLFRNFYTEMSKRGHYIIVSVKEIPSAIHLLDLYGIPYFITGKRGVSIAGKAVSQISHNLNILSLVREKKISIGIGSSISIAHVSRLTKMFSIILDDDDDEVEPLMTRFGHPFAHLLLSPEALAGKRKKKSTFYYPGYHELAYLHPDRFKPDSNVLAEVGLSKGEPFSIMRFSAFKAHHDIGIRGLSAEQKLFLIKLLLQAGKVFITSENEIEPGIEQFRLKISPQKIHSLMSFAKMFIGDSQTMASEAAVLGIPSLRCNSFAGRISYLVEQEDKYGLTFSFHPSEFNLLVDKLNMLLSMNNLSSEWQRRKERMLIDKLDITTFLVWLVENHPSSTKRLLHKPDSLMNFESFINSKNPEL
jgi:uncharacterized protein